MALTKANRTVLDLEQATVGLPSEPFELANKKYVDDKFNASLNSPAAVDIIVSTVTATLGQTLVTVPSYRVGTNSVIVFVDGVYQSPVTSYVENGLVDQMSTTITFSAPLDVGVKINTIVINTGDLVGGVPAVEDLSDVDINAVLSSFPIGSRILVQDGATWKPMPTTNLGTVYSAGAYLNLTTQTFNVKTSETGGLDSRYVQPSVLTGYSLATHNHDSTYVKLVDSWTTTQWINAHTWYWPGWSTQIPNAPDVISSLPAKVGGPGQKSYVRQMFPGGFFIESGIIDGSVTEGKYIPAGIAGNEVCTIMSFVASESDSTVTTPSTPLIVKSSIGTTGIDDAEAGGIKPYWTWTPENKTVSYIAFGVIKPAFTNASSLKTYPLAPTTLKDQKYPTGTNLNTFGITCF